MEYRDVARAIRLGELDQHLDELTEEIRRRQKIEAHYDFYDIRVGDTGHLKNIGMGGKYLNGAPVKVVEKYMVKIGVQITDRTWDMRRFRGTIRISPNLFEPDIKGTAQPAFEHLPSGIKNVTPIEEQIEEM